MARTEREKQDELLGMIRRDFTPKPPQLLLVQEQSAPDSDVADYGLEEIICADERDDDREATENLPGH